MSYPKGPNWVPVQALTKCNRCGEDGLAWQVGKSGKNYLCTARQRADGSYEADRRGFHVCAPSNSPRAAAPPWPGDGAPARRTPPVPAPAPRPATAAQVGAQPAVAQALADHAVALCDLANAIREMTLAIKLNK